MDTCVIVRHRVPLNYVTALPEAERAAASRALLALEQSSPAETSAVAVAMTEQRVARKRRRPAEGESRSGSDYDEEESELVAAHHRTALSEDQFPTPEDDEAEGGRVRFLCISPSLAHTSSAPASDDSSIDAEGDSLRARFATSDPDGQGIGRAGSQGASD